MQQDNLLGIIGGLGPMATAYFLELTVKMTAAERDQDHLRAVLMEAPEIPDRTAHILDRNQPSPLPALTAYAKKLEALGCGCIAIPCITSHYFFPELAETISIPLLNIVEETARHLKENGVRSAGVMATTGTVRTGLFQRALEQEGVDCVLPDEEHQAMVMRVIYDDVKAGRPVEPEVFGEAASHLRQRGAECLILGCTELSLANRERPLGQGCLDALEVLARAAVLACGKPLRPAYGRLITQ